MVDRLPGLFIPRSGTGNIFHAVESGQTETEVRNMLKKSKLTVALILMLAISAVAFTVRTPNANANEIVIENFSFEPATLTVKAGTTVTWVNHDDEPHTATATDKSFNSKTLDNGDRFSQEFKAPGTYNYYCALHPKMTGKIIVK
jgi:plastocyanin